MTVKDAARASLSDVKAHTARNRTGSVRRAGHSARARGMAPRVSRPSCLGGSCPTSASWCHHAALGLRLRLTLLPGEARPGVPHRISHTGSPPPCVSISPSVVVRLIPDDALADARIDSSGACCPAPYPLAPPALLSACTSSKWDRGEHACAGAATVSFDAWIHAFSPTKPPN